MFQITKSEYGHCGFTMLFANGVEASVQFGKRNDCDNRHKDGSHDSCANAEVVFFQNRKRLGEPHSYTTPDDLVELLRSAKDIAAKPIYELMAGGVIIDHGLLLGDAPIKYSSGDLWEAYKASFLEDDTVRANLFWGAIEFYKKKALA